MKYFIIDTETTDTSVKDAQVLQFTMIFEDTDKQLPLEDLPKLNLYIENIPLIGSPQTLKFNSKLLTFIENNPDILVKPKDVIKYVIEFVYKCLEIPFEKIEKYKFTVDGEEKIKYIFPKVLLNLAGKNISNFDIPIIQNNFNLFYNDYNLCYRHRILDPAILYTDIVNDECIPDLKECLRRADIKFDESKLHDASYDCWAVLLLLRSFYMDKK